MATGFEKQPDSEALKRVQDLFFSDGVYEAMYSSSDYHEFLPKNSVEVSLKLNVLNGRGYHKNGVCWSIFLTPLWL